METILFTDIEGSTRLWEEHRDAMSAALARHDAILSRAIEGAGGRVLKTTGDGCIAIFGAPPDAVSAARGIQAALAGETWGETGPIRARIGIHYGETENRDNDYFGPAMNRAARIMAAGHGGQVLLSESVAHLVEGALPEGAALRDLGAHRLKDLTQPEHLYQLIAPELPSEFPALRTLDARPGNLPLQTTEFLGRSAELAAIEAIVRSPGARLVTITGPGGSGKTRIALQAAAEMLDDFRDGAFFVDLSAERTPDGAFEAVVRALDLPVSGNGGPLETLKVRLRDKQMLLVLDNFEQVIDAASGVSELLQALPEIELIVTSRESLRIRGEHVFPVPPLSLPGANAPFDAVMASEAVRLFEARGRAVRPDFMVTPENARTVAAICERLDALPLAIELAAARLRLFSPGDLLARLQDRLDVVGAGGRDLPDRQRTLWGAIGWSYDLLDEGECDLLQLMSVFSSADLDGLEAVAGGAGVTAPVLDTLESLVDKSLVESHPDRTQRFSMLRMVKVFAGERLADSPEKEQQAREAHARYFTEVARRLKESLRGSGQDAALGELEAELGNLRTAWEYWLSMGDIEQLFALEDPLWSLHAAKGWYHASIDLTQSMLSALAESGRASEFAARELALRTNLARALMAVGGYNAEVEVALGRALELAEAGGMTEEEFPMLRALASIYNQRTSWDAAIAIGRQLIALGERKQDRLMLAEGHYVIGVNTLFTHPMSALGELEEAIELFGPEAPAGERLRLGPNSAVMARTAMALMLWMGGSLDRAVEVSDEALLMARRMNHPYTLAYALYHSGFLAINRGRFEECVRFADELRDVSAQHGYPIWGTLATLLDGVATAALGDASEGLARAEAAVELYQGLTPPPAFWPFVLMLRAAVHAMAGMPNRSVELLEEANAALASVDAEAPPLTVMRADMMRLLPEPDVEAIEELYLSAIASGRATGHRLAALTGATGLVTLRRELGKTPDGIEELAAVYRTFDEGRDERDVVAARRLLGLLAD